MTCYDLRFPDGVGAGFTGADVLALPTGWVRGRCERAAVVDALLAASAGYRLLYMIAAGVW